MGLKIKIVFGSDNIKEYNKEKYPQDIITTKEFNTQAEVEAYKMGLSDCLGWYDYLIVDES